MMNLGRDDAMAMSLWEYESRLWHWNDAHRVGEDSSPGPDRETTERMLAKINADPRMTR